MSLLYVVHTWKYRTGFAVAEKRASLSNLVPSPNTFVAASLAG
jgi:hypothetical protein